MTLTELLYPLYKSLAFRFDPEFIHGVSIEALPLMDKLGLISSGKLNQQPVKCMGLDFPNILGLGAGLDKNGVCVDAFTSLGFGFVEVGTVTPRPQKGNDKPRLFRLLPDNAIINRMGFNNCGVDQLIKNLLKQKRKCILGINIGKNKDTPDEGVINDYMLCLDKVYSLADYVAINISSPNTPGLREYADGSQLGTLLSTLKNRQKELSQIHSRYVPLALKISPDMSDQQIEAIVQLVKDIGLDAIIATNTTVKRENLQSTKFSTETGGLSGNPLNIRSTEVIRNIRNYAGKELAIIGVGGISTKQDALDKIKAGANLLQIYTGFIYRGPGLIREILSA